MLASGAPLLGISTVTGNTSAAVAADCACRLVAAVGRRVDVVAGGEDAARQIAALPGGTTLLALGPLTNVAAALARDPSLAARIRVALVGGNLSSRGRWPPLWPFEFNLSMDAAAARAVFASPVARDVYPLDVCRQLTVGVAELRRIGGESLVGAWLAAGSWRWLARAPLRYRRLRFPVWDLVPALDALGLLPSTHAERRLVCVGRGRLVDSAAAVPARVLTSLEARPALAAFRRLLA